MNDTPDRPYDEDDFFDDFFELVMDAQKKGVPFSKIKLVLNNFMEGANRSYKS